MVLHAMADYLGRFRFTERRFRIARINIVRRAASQSISDRQRITTYTRFPAPAIEDAATRSDEGFALDFLLFPGGFGDNETITRTHFGWDEISIGEFIA